MTEATNDLINTATSRRAARFGDYRRASDRIAKARVGMTDREAVQLGARIDAAYKLKEQIRTQSVDYSLQAGLKMREAAYAMSDIIAKLEAARELLSKGQ
jgi:hypothetical protein